MDSEPLFLRRGRVLPKKRSPKRIGRLALVAALLLLGAAGLYRFLGGSLFALQRFDISGNERARTEEILKSLEPWRASNVVTLDLAPLAGKLQQIPWIERVTLSKKFPDGLSVRVVEAKAVALLREEGKLWWLDARASRSLRTIRGPIAPSTFSSPASATRCRKPSLSWKTFAPRGRNIFPRSRKLLRSRTEVSV